MVKDKYGRVVPQREPTEEEARVIRNLCQLGRTREMRTKPEFIKVAVETHRSGVVYDLSLADFWEKAGKEEGVEGVDEMGG